MKQLQTKAETNGRWGWRDGNRGREKEEGEGGNTEGNRYREIGSPVQQKMGERGLGTGHGRAAHSVLPPGWSVEEGGKTARGKEKRG
eukprot:582770-Rhodomonas_salina.2